MEKFREINFIGMLDGKRERRKKNEKLYAEKEKKKKKNIVRYRRVISVSNRDRYDGSTVDVNLPS